MTAPQPSLGSVPDTAPKKSASWGGFSPLHTGLALGALILFYFSITALSWSRHLWFDELFTYYIAQAPDMPRFWQELRLDLNPPLSYLAVRASIHLLGDSAFAARLPFVLSFLTGSLCFLWFAAQRLNLVYGILAVLVFWSTPFIYYATEARSYGLLLGFFGIAMVAWQKSERSLFAVAALFLAITGMMMTHFFALFYIGPFLLAELVRQYRHREFRWITWAAILLPTIYLFLYLRMMSSYQTILFPHAFQASPRKIIAFFDNTLSPESSILLLAFCASLILTWRSRLHSEENVATAPEDLGFAAGLLLLPIVINVVQMRSHGAFFDRYALPTPLAYGMFAAFFVARFTNVNRKAAAIACGVIFAYVLGTQIVSPLAALRYEKNHPQATQSIDEVNPSLPLVAASNLTFLEMDKYGDAATVGRLHYLSDKNLALRYTHATIFEGLETDKKFFPIRGSVDPYRKFVAEHPQFLVLTTPDFVEDWLLRALLDAHAVVRYVGDYPGFRDRQLYEITMPGA